MHPGPQRDQVAVAHRPSQRLFALTVTTWSILSVTYVAYLAHSLRGVSLDALTLGLVVAKTAVELVAGLYGLAFFLGAIAYLGMRERTVDRGAALSNPPPVGIVYLCCDDADRVALESLTALDYPGRITLIVQDDSRTTEGRRELETLLASVKKRVSWDVRLLRRPERDGGKPAAVNYVLEQTAHLYDYFLLCDNDSIIVDPSTVRRAIHRFADAPDIGVVQCRTIHVPDARYCDTNALLAQSISAFHAFLAPAARFGWMPFIGHNAFLRTTAVQDVDGMTPGFFSDDLDLTVRLNLRGHRVVYADDIAMAEIHPPSYAAFRKRSYKWAYGCVQSLRAHCRAVVTSSEFSPAAKFSFFQFTGFYLLQALLFFYLVFVLVAIPMGALGGVSPNLAPSLIVGTVLVGLVYAPLLAYYVKASTRAAGWRRALLLCGLVYGGTDFSVLRGVCDGFLRRTRRWVPTNQVTARTMDRVVLAEAVFGFGLLLVPALRLPELLFLPCWYLFAGKFLFGPALSHLYQDAS